MGRMLAQLHMAARNEARGIKVVLGANISSTILNNASLGFGSLV
jgi:hypothetical protein